MAKVLYIEASPRKKRSASIAVAHTFLDAYKMAHPKDEVVVVDLWNRHLPEFDGDIIDAKYAILHNQAPTEPQKKAWKKVEEIIAEFKSADKYVFSLPMWNFGIPYKLKHYIDIITQPGYTFSFSPEKGYSGLINGKKAALIFARGGAYGAETGAANLDHQTSYMNLALGFIGFQNPAHIYIEPTLAGGPEKKEAALASAKTQAAKLASSF